MIRRQVGFVFLVALICAVSREPEAAMAIPAKCDNTGCWNMPEGDAWWSGVGRCFSYNATHAPPTPMSTNAAVAGKRVEQKGTPVGMWKSAGNCASFCTAAGNHAAMWAGDWEAVDPPPTLWLCE